MALYASRVEMQLPQIELVALSEALGRILARRVIADRPYPAAPRSLMDGFALRSSETPGSFKIAGEIRIGYQWDGVVPSGSGVRIPTGGVVPDGADAVVPIEDAQDLGDRIEVDHAVPQGDCITPAGSDMRASEVLLEPGRRLRGAELGVLATLGVDPVPVYRKPLIGVISSGDELVDVSASPGPAQVRDSNRWAVAGTLEEMGASVRHLPTAQDDPAMLEALLSDGLSSCDALVLTGGSSVGERDFTPRVVQGLGEPGVIVHGLRVKPGKPTMLALVAGKPILGLPGNPTSALMILQAVAAPIIAGLTGARLQTAEVQAVLGAPCRTRSGWTWYVPARLDEAGATPVAYPLELKSSSVSLLARASGFLVLDETVEALSAGEPVRVRRFVGS